MHKLCQSYVLRIETDHRSRIESQLAEGESAVPAPVRHLSNQNPLRNSATSRSSSLTRAFSTTQAQTVPAPSHPPHFPVRAQTLLHSNLLQQEAPSQDHFQSLPREFKRTEFELLAHRQTNLHSFHDLSLMGASRSVRTFLRSFFFNVLNLGSQFDRILDISLEPIITTFESNLFSQLHRAKDKEAHHRSGQRGSHHSLQHRGLIQQRIDSENRQWFRVMFLEKNSYHKRERNQKGSTDSYHALHQDQSEIHSLRRDSLAESDSDNVQRQQPHEENGGRVDRQPQLETQLK